MRAGEEGPGGTEEVSGARVGWEKVNGDFKL